MKALFINCFIAVILLLAPPSMAITIRKVEPTKPVYTPSETPAKQPGYVPPKVPVKQVRPSLVVTEPAHQQYTMGWDGKISWIANNVPGNVDILIRSQNGSWFVARGVPPDRGTIPWRTGQHMDGYVKTGFGYEVVVNAASLGQVAAKSRPFKIFGDIEMKNVSYKPETRELTIEIFTGIHGSMLSPFIQRREYALFSYRCENASQPITWNQLWPNKPEDLDAMGERLKQTFILPMHWRGTCTATVDPEDFVLELDESNNTKTIELPYSAPVK